jgi:hypothetical protein
MGDTDPKAWILAIVGGVLGGLLGGSTGAAIGAYGPVFILQLGLPDDPENTLHDSDLEDSQVARGFSRLFYAVFASLIPGLVGLILGYIASSIVR